MPKERKRRKDAVQYEFDLYNCKDYLIKDGNKTYVFQSVIAREATKLCGKTRPVSSLYRDLHRAKSAKEIYGVRAICLEDFNNEGLLCTVHMYPEKGEGVLKFYEEF